MMQYDYLRTKKYKIDIDVCSKEKVFQKICHENNSLYYMINYDKSMICFDDTENGKYKSVVLSYPEKDVLCFSPEKSMIFEKFIEKYPEINDTILINEFIEGTMINLFYDYKTKKWLISTRKRIGGKNRIMNEFTNNKTFYELFLESLSANVDDDLNDLPFIKMLPMSYCYSFVLNNMKSTPISYLVAVHKIYFDNTIKYILPTEYEKWKFFVNVVGLIQFPKRIENYNTYESLNHYYNDIHNNSHSKGCVITNLKTGERTKIINIEYSKKKESQKIDNNLLYQYLCYRRINVISKKYKKLDKNIEETDFFFWIKNIPYHKNNFLKIHEKVENFIKNVHSSYLDFYVYKSRGQKDISEKFMKYIFKIHYTIYIPSLRTKEKIRITKDIVHDFFNKIEPNEMLYIINNI